MNFIRKTKDFHEIFDVRKRIYGNLFSINYKRYLLHPHLRVGVIAGKKVGNAVKRNKIKRRVKSYFRENKELWNYPLGLIVIARQPAAFSDWAVFKTELGKLTQKILKNENFQ